MDILQDLPDSEMEALMNSTPVHTAEKGTEFYGLDGPEVLFLLKSGKVEMFRRSTDGKRLTLAIIEPGTVFGEMSLIGQRTVGTCATAIEDSDICALSRSDVETLMHDRPGGSANHCRAGQQASAYQGRAGGDGIQRCDGSRGGSAAADVQRWRRD